MNIEESHHHGFAKWEWPFSDPDNSVAFSTVRVFRENFPILLVSHDEDGDWQFLCGTTLDKKHIFVACLGCVFERDRTIGELADLPIGWTATRDYIGAPWHREQNPPEENES